MVRRKIVFWVLFGRRYCRYHYNPCMVNPPFFNYAAIFPSHSLFIHVWGKCKFNLHTFVTSKSDNVNCDSYREQGIQVVGYRISMNMGESILRLRDMEGSPQWVTTMFSPLFSFVIHFSLMSPVSYTYLFG